LKAAVGFRLAQSNLTLDDHEGSKIKVTRGFHHCVLYTVQSSQFAARIIIKDLVTYGQVSQRKYQKRCVSEKSFECIVPELAISSTAKALCGPNAHSASRWRQLLTAVVLRYTHTEIIRE